MNIKKIILLTLTIIMSIFVLIGCNKENELQTTINKYSNLLNENNYDEIYEGLSKKSKEYIDSEYNGKDGFINKYSAIYSAMGVNNVKIEIKDLKNESSIPVNMSMNTIAGDLKFEDLNIELVKEDKSYKIVWNESMIIPGMIQGDKVRVEITNGNRGRILDRDGNLLAYNGDVNSLNIDQRIFDEHKDENIIKLASILDISEEYIKDKLDKNTNKEQLVFIVKLSKYEDEKISDLNEVPGVIVQRVISRVYANGEAFGSLLGYIGSITAEELEKNPGKGYTSTSRIGKNGLEQVYEERLRSKDGVHIYIDRNGEQITVYKTEASDGEDIQLAIDSKLQEKIYKEMDKQKGASIAMDSKTGEVLAMVSSPSYDSNTLVTYKTKTIAREWEESNNAEFDNRANNSYSPGSTMKLITAAIGLENKVINPNERMDIQGLSWQNGSSWGDYAVSRVKDVKKVGLYEAVKYSDNIYFADKAIKIGSERFIEGSKRFGIGEDIKFEYPMAKSQISNSGELNDEILLADTGYGQGQVLTTPLNITMAYSALANEGNIMQPRLVISENTEAKIYKEAISKEYISELKKDFIGVINDSDGSGNLAKIDGVNLAGKTGTAEIKSSKDDENGNENSWFVAVDLDNSKVSISMVMEDMKDKSTSKYLVPKVKNILENYIKEQ